MCVCVFVLFVCLFLLLLLTSLLTAQKTYVIPIKASMTLEGKQINLKEGEYEAITREIHSMRHYAFRSGHIFD